MDFWNSYNNTIVANDVIDCQIATIAEGNSSNNKIYLNNFIKENQWREYIYDQYTDPNIRSQYPSVKMSINTWNSDGKGNYWGDYNGSDLNQDGIGDTPYSINSENFDYYPLMKPVNIENVNITLPSWTITSLPNPSPSPNPSTDLQPQTFPTMTVMVLVFLAVACLVTFFIYVRRSNKKN